jgi:hypothetical protein
MNLSKIRKKTQSELTLHTKETSVENKPFDTAEICKLTIHLDLYKHDNGMQY